MYCLIQGSGLKLWARGDYAPLSKIVLLMSPWTHSFNQSLSWQYIFVYYVMSPTIYDMIIQHVFLPLRHIIVLYDTT